MPTLDGTSGWLGGDLRNVRTKNKITCQEAASSSKQGRVRRIRSRGFRGEGIRLSDWWPLEKGWKGRLKAA